MYDVNLKGYFDGIFAAIKAKAKTDEIRRIEMAQSFAKNKVASIKEETPEKIKKAMREKIEILAQAGIITDRDAVKISKDYGVQAPPPPVPSTGGGCYSSGTNRC